MTGLTAFAVLLSVWFTPTLATSDEEPPRILTLDEQIADCLRLDSDERDVCLANLTLRFGDPAPCLAAPEGRCAALVAPVAMQRCADSFQGAERALCEMTNAAELESPEACDEATERASCVGAVATAVEDPTLIVEHIEDPVARDTHLAAYLNATGDERILDWIEDAARSDAIRVFSAFTLGAKKGKILPEDYCNLRGGYGGEYPEDEFINLRLCRQLVALSNWVVRRRAIGDGAEQDVSRVLSGFQTGDTELSELFPEATRFPDDLVVWRKYPPEQDGEFETEPDGSGSYQEHVILGDRLYSRYVLKPSDYDIKFQVELVTGPPDLLVKGRRYPILIEARATGLAYPVRSFVGAFGLQCEGPCRIIDKSTKKPFGGRQLDLNNPAHTVKAEVEATGPKGSSFKIVLGLKQMRVTWTYGSYTPD